MDVDAPDAAPLLDELDLVVGMPVKPWTAADLTVKQERRHRDAALIGQLVDFNL